MKMNSTDSTESTKSTDEMDPKPWDGDAFSRRGFAEFLTNHLVAQTHPPQGGLRSHCLALDAEWGTGKSYFVHNWRLQLALETKHPTFLFDAWSADYQADPFIAFMAAFKEAIESAIESLPTSKSVKAKAKRKLSSSISSIRQAWIPMSKALARGAFERLAPGAWEEIRTIAEGKKQDLSEIDFENLKGEALDSVRDSLQTYFRESLNEQANKQRLISDFRTEIQDTLEILKNDGEAELPFFVFIDEIDRCRPSFAIALLEQLKHIFNIEGLCYVVSTNLPQMAHAVRGVYGAEFNGRTYLQRFFDSECSLPSLSMRDFVQSQLSLYPTFASEKVSLGLPHGGFSDPALSSVSAADTFTWVIEVFGLDLRSQKRLVLMVNACLGSLESHSKKFLMWLVILGAAKIKSSKLFDCLTQPNKGGNVLAAIWSEEAPNDAYRRYNGRATGEERNFGRTAERKIQLIEVAQWLYSVSQESQNNLMRTISDFDGNVYDYRDKTYSDIAYATQETEQKKSPHMVLRRPLISGYDNLINYSGHFGK